MKAICVSTLGFGVAMSAGVALAASDAPDGALEEIVVTAQKRSEPLQDVPIAISAVSGDSLTALGASSITALAEVLLAGHVGLTLYQAIARVMHTAGLYYLARGCITPVYIFPRTLCDFPRP